MIEPLLAALPTLREVVACRSFWAILLEAIAVWLLLPNRIRHGTTIGGVLAIVAAGLFASDWPLLGDGTAQAVFWLLAGVTIGAAVCTICSKVHALDIRKGKGILACRARSGRRIDHSACHFLRP